MPEKRKQQSRGTAQSKPNTEKRTLKKNKAKTSRRSESPETETRQNRRETGTGQKRPAAREQSRPPAKAKQNRNRPQKRAGQERDRQRPGKQQPQKGQGPKQDKPKKEYYSQSIIPVKDIKDGIIETTDGRFVLILEVEPINFTLLSLDEQYLILCEFAAWLKVAHIDVQFKSMTRKADSNKHIQAIQHDLQGETNEACLALADDYLQLVYEVGSQEALTRRFFLIFQYEQDESGLRGSGYDVARGELYSAEAQARASFARCGNEIVQPKDRTAATIDILYTFFNRLSCIDETSAQRVERIKHDYLAAKGGRRRSDQEIIDSIPVVDYIAPRGLDMKHRDFFMMDGMYYSIMCITASGYPSSVRGGWTSLMVNAGDGIDVDMFLHRENRSRTIDAVGRKIRNNRVKMKNIQDTSSDFDDLANAINAGFFIKDQISNYNEDLYYMVIMITLSAPTYDELLRRRQRFTNLMKGRDYALSRCNFQQEAAFKSVMPLIKPDKNLFRKHRRNIMSSSAASSYMYTSFEMSDDNGVLMGINRQNNSLCIMDLFNTKVNKNANLTMVGTSGAGKTFTLQLLALRMRMRGIQCFIIAPTKGHEFARACRSIGGQFIRIGPGSPHCINIMEIRHTISPEMELIDGEDYSGGSLRSKKIQQMMTFFSLLVPDITNEEEQLLDQTLVDVYEKFGITEDNDSLYIDKNADPPVMKKMPILGDLYDMLKDNERTERLAIILNRFVNGSAKNFNQQTNVDLSNKYTVLDLSGLESDRKLLPVGMMIAVDYVWDVAKADRTQKKAIMIDEIWTLIGANSNKFAAEFCLEIFKLIRGYGGAAIAATQDMSDFFGLEGGKFGRAIINNSKTKIVLNLEMDEANYVKDVLKLTQNEVRSITKFERGEGMIISNNTKVPIWVRASQLEKDMITTDRAELANLLERKKRQEQAALPDTNQSSA